MSEVGRYECRNIEGILLLLVVISVSLLTE